jgi:hypothetical protein
MKADISLDPRLNLSLLKKVRTQVRLYGQEGRNVRAGIWQNCEGTDVAHDVASF